MVNSKCMSFKHNIFYLYQVDGFTLWHVNIFINHSIRMADKYLDHVGNVDVISDAEVCTHKFNLLLCLNHSDCTSELDFHPGHCVHSVKPLLIFSHIFHFYFLGYRILSTCWRLHIGKLSFDETSGTFFTNNYLKTETLLWCIVVLNFSTCILYHSKVKTHCILPSLLQPIFSIMFCSIVLW